MEQPIAAAIDAIVSDHRTSAAALAALAAEVLLRRSQVGEAASPDAFRTEILRSAWTLIRAHPLNAPLVNLVNLVLWKMEGAETPAGLRRAVSLATTEFQRQLRYHEGRVADAALPLINDGSTVITFAHSTTVRAALIHAHRAGRRFVVLCAETRPLCEGREMAVELAEAGITATLLVDSAALAALPTAQLVLVGAEHLTGEGLVNRVGTSVLALTAQAAGVPIYGLCGSEKFLPPDYLPPPQPSRPSAEIWPEAPQGVTMRNVYFDRTPLADLAGVVTEQGVLVMPAIEAWLASIKLHRALRGDESHE
jgi:translation initiation factor eIF-2B subunit delta